MSRTLCLVALVVVPVALGAAARGLAHPDVPAAPGERAMSGEVISAADGASVIRLTTIARIELDDVRGVVTRGDLAYVTEAAFGLHVYDMRDPSTPAELGSAATFGTASRVVLDGDVALVADGQSSVSLYDISTPASVRFLSTLGLGSPEKALAARDGIGLVADGRFLALFDFTGPGAAHEVGRIEMDFFGPSDIAMSGGFAYVAQHWDRLRVIDIADPASPGARGALDPSDWTSAQSVAVDGARAYIGERLQGAYFIPTPAPPTPGPSPTGGTLTPTPSATQPPDGGRFTVADVSDPDAPRAIGSSEGLPYRPMTALHADGNLVWALAWPDSGWNELMALDVSDPAHPAPVPVEIEPYVWGDEPQDVAIDGDIVYLATRQGLLVLRRVREWSGTPAFLPFVAGLSLGTSGGSPHPVP